MAQTNKGRDELGTNREKTADKSDVKETADKSGVNETGVGKDGKKFSGGDEEENFKYRLYEGVIPKIGDKVVFEFSKLEENLVKVLLVEYDNHEANIIHSELTRKKNVASIQKLCPIGQMGVAEVLSIETTKDNSSYIFLSVKNLSEKDKDDYMIYYQKSKRLLNLMKRISATTGRSVFEVCKDISWALYAQTDGSKHPLDYIDHSDKLPLLLPVRVVDDTISVGTTSYYAESNNDDVFNDQHTRNTTTTDLSGASEGVERKHASDGAEKERTVQLSRENVQLLMDSHEIFFGKLFSQKRLRLGLLSYDMEGANAIKKSLNGLIAVLESECPDVDVHIIFRDIPIYEICLKSINKDSIESSVKTILKYFPKEPLIFKHISTA